MKTLLLLSLILLCSCGAKESLHTYEEYPADICLEQIDYINKCIDDKNDPDNYDFNKYQCELEIFKELRDCGYYIYDENGQMIGRIYE